MKGKVIGMNLFKTDKKRLAYHGTILRMVVIAAVFAVICWIRVALFPGTGWHASLFYLILLLVLYLGFVCIDELIATSDNRSQEAFRTGTGKLKWSPVVCDMPRLLKLLQAVRPDGGIVLFVRHDDTVYRMGVISDYSKQKGFFDQAYFIGDRIFETEQEFLSCPLKDGVTLADIPSLTVLSADDSDPRPLMDRLC